MSQRNQAKRAKAKTEKKAKEATSWLARIGYLAKGIVYILIGVLTLQAAFGLVSASVNKNIVLIKIFNQPYGKWLLALLAFGLGSYAVWRIVQGLFDPEGNQELTDRVGHFVTGLAYAGITYIAFELVLGYGASRNNSAIPQKWTAIALGQPIGRILVGVVGAALIALGLFIMYRGWTIKFEKHLKNREMSAQMRRWAIRLGRFGYMARGVIYVVIGVFFFQAAIFFQASRVGGFGQAIQALANQPYGPWLAGIVGAGLTAYGLYSIVLAFFRRLRL